MSDKVSLIKKISKQFAKFGIIGVIAFIIDYGTMLALTELFGIDYLISTTIGFIVALVFNYFASMRFVFARRDGMSRKKRIRHICCAIRYRARFQRRIDVRERRSSRD